MATGPKGQRRPADAIGNAVKVMRITPPKASGVSDRLWSMDDIAALVDAVNPTLGKRGPYKRREGVEG